MKYITLIFAMLMSATAIALSPAQAAQCTTSELDLMCPSGQVLQGIRPNGTKICVSKLAGLNLMCPNGQALAGITPQGQKVCKDSGASKAVQLYRCPNVTASDVNSHPRAWCRTTLGSSNCNGQKSVNNKCTYSVSRGGHSRCSKGTSIITKNCTPIN